MHSKSNACATLSLLLSLSFSLTLSDFLPLSLSLSLSFKQPGDRAESIAAERSAAGTYSPEFQNGSLYLANYLAAVR